eukprot:jgi/Bigna1/144540/aug1.88_g19248
MPLAPPPRDMDAYMKAQGTGEYPFRPSSGIDAKNAAGRFTEYLSGDGMRNFSNERLQELIEDIKAQKTQKPIDYSRFQVNMSSFESSLRSSNVTGLGSVLPDIAEMRLEDREESAVEPNVTTDFWIQPWFSDMCGYADVRDGVGTNASFNEIGFFLFDKDVSGMLYVIDNGFQAVRRIDPTTRNVTTVAGGLRREPTEYDRENPEGYYAETELEGYFDGVGTTVRFRRLSSLALDPSSGDIWVVDTGSQVVRKIAQKTGEVTTVVGRWEGSEGGGCADGKGTAALLNVPISICYDKARHGMVLGEQENACLRWVNLTDLSVERIAGNRRPGDLDSEIGRQAELNKPLSPLQVDDGSGDIYFLDTSFDWEDIVVSQAVRRITLSGKVETVAGAHSVGFVDGRGKNARFRYPVSMTYDSSRHALFIVDAGNNAIRSLSLENQEVTTLVGWGFPRTMYDKPQVELESPGFISCLGPGKMLISCGSIPSMLSLRAMNQSTHDSK